MAYTPELTRGEGCPELRRMARVSRRTVLQAGAIGALGLGTATWRQLAAMASPSGVTAGFGRAKACIFLFMWGGPSQLDTLDPKPEAPDEVRGPFATTATRLAGVHISEHFRHLPQWMDRVALVRSLTHNDPAHLSSAHATVAGNWAPVINSDATPPSRRDTPAIGSVMAKRRAETGGQASSHDSSGESLPPFITMPWKAYHPAAPGGQAPGQDGGWLGAGYDPMLLTGDPSQPGWNVPAITLRDGITADRLASRRQLLQALDLQQRAWQQSQAAQQLNLQQRQAYELLGSSRVKQAFEIEREPAEVRQRYGLNIHGQCVLLARRLVEHGVPFVSVNWHNDNMSFWDTHGNNFNRLKNDLIPPSDQALTALLEDLEVRGMLAETLVVWVGEFGRKPQITTANSGREHWPFCYSGILAGGGIRGGQVYGRSDQQAAYPVDNPVSPLDFAATMYHALGVPADATLQDQLGRPHHVVQGTVIDSLFG